MFATSKLVFAPDWQAVMSDCRLDDLWALPGEVVKRARSTEVRRCRLGEREVYLKKYWVTQLNQLVSGVTRGALFGRSKVRREFDNLQRLRQWGLDAPAPVAWGEERRAGWLVRSCLMSEAVPSPLPLDSLIRSWEGHAPAWPPAADGRDGARPSSIRKDLLTRLADYVRRLHEHQFEHHDLYWRNIILSGGSLDHFYLIDAHKGRLWCEDLVGRAQDLATLDAPAPWFFRRTERLRFFLRYRQHHRLNKEDKELIRQTLRRAAPLRQRQLARVREARG